MKRFKFAVTVALLVYPCRWALGPLPAARSQTNAPAAPTGVEASDNAYNNKVGIRWDAMRGATRYQVYRNTTNDPTSAISVGATDDAALFDTTAVAGQIYFYWVRAENAGGASGFSESDTGVRGAGATTGLNPPTAPAGNPTTAAKVALGKALFWDEQMASSRTVACGTCHRSRFGGSDPRSLTDAANARHPGADNIFGTADDVQGSPGVPLAESNGRYLMSAAFGLREQVTKRRSMSHINAGYPNRLFWDGRAEQVFRDPLTNTIVLNDDAALESQALEPPVSDVEMGHKGRDWNDVAARIAEVKPLGLSPSVPVALAAWIGDRSYPELFAEAFGAPEVTPVRIAMALASYQRSLYSDRAPIDRGDLTEQEARGRQVFNANDCNDCHNQTLFGTNQLQNTGVRPSSEDPGRFAVTNNQNDLGRFRSVSLRNVELRAPYMHNGRFRTLEEVVEFYNRGGDFPGPNTNTREIRPRNLTAQQKADLVAFLKRPLTDPRVAAELPPFDRPQLYTESMRAPQVVGNGLAGTANKIPRVVAIEPPLLGNPRFTVGVYDAEGSHATLVVDASDPGAVMRIPATASFAHVTAPLTVANGSGYTSVGLAIPNNPALRGATLYGRWYITDGSNADVAVAVSPTFKFTVFGAVRNAAPQVTSVSAASLAIGGVAPESIVAGFGASLSTMTVAANSLPLPETLGGVTVVIKDVLGIERNAPLFFVSPGQINYLIPASVAQGEGSVTIKLNGNVVAEGLLQIAPVAPGLFTMDANGRGLPAALALRIKADGAQFYEPIAQFNPATNQYEAAPIDLGAATDQVLLIAFGTGFRKSMATATATIGGVEADVLYAGAQGALAGVDQVNLRIPRALAGRGVVEVALRTGGKTANSVTIHIK